MFCKNCGTQQHEEDRFCHNCGVNASNENSYSHSATAIKMSTQNANEMSIKEAEERNKRNKKVGLLWLVAPIIILIATLFLYAIISFITNQISSNQSVIIQIIRILLGLVGIVAVIGVFIGIPLGIIYLNKRYTFPGMIFDPRSGKGDMSEIPKEIAGWNWGAAGLTWIWGASHRVWLSFLVFIPILNFIVWIYLGIKGNELAWRADKWESVEKFLEVERKWRIWGIIFFILGVLATISNISSSIE